MDSIEVYVWLILFIVLTAIEMATFQLVTIWFAVGAVAAFITSLFSTSLEIQLIVFLAVSMLLLILVRPIAGRFLQTKTVKTNVDSLIGDYATVTARIHNQEGFGKAVIRGQECCFIAVFCRYRVSALEGIPYSYVISFHDSFHLIVDTRFIARKDYRIFNIALKACGSSL